MARVLTAFLGFILLIAPATLSDAICGDVNNDSNINILDITRLISFLYMDGPGPLCGETDTMVDIDGNVYQTVKIGDQWWMAKNLKVTHYRNGEPIPHITIDDTWSNLTTGAYSEYANNPDNVDIYGRLYNWYAVVDSRNIAPEGWHVPTDAEWKQMEIYLGMSEADADAEAWRGTDEGDKLKEAGTAHWPPPNSSATNESGFTALPGGYRSFVGNFGYINYRACFWSTTEYDDDHAWDRRLYDHFAGILRMYNPKQYGYSIRCVKD